MAWADSDYGYKKKITIDPDKVAGDETDFPILISVTDGDLADTGNGGHVQNSSGYDIVFYDSTENTLLKHEIERYVNTSGLLVFWVKIPSISGTSDTDLYIYYGKSGVTVDPSSTDTWDSSFLGVYHLDESSGATCYDSTGGSNNGTYEGDLPTRVTGKTGYGQDFDGNGDYISLPTGVFVDYSGTFECWFEADNTNIDEYMFYNRAGGTLNYIYFMLYNDGRYACKILLEGATQLDISAGVRSTDWEKYGYAYQTDDGIIKANKITIGTDNSMSTADDWVYDRIQVGMRDSGSYCDGVMDEVRISDIRRSNNWLDTSYDTQNDPSTFMGWGDEETIVVVRVPRPTAAVGNPLIF